MSKPGPCGAPGFGLGGTTIAGCGASGAAAACAALAAVAASGVPAALPAGFAISGAAVCAADCVAWGDAAAEVSAFCEHPPSATAPHKANRVKTFWLMVNLYFTSHAAVLPSGVAQTAIRTQMAPTAATKTWHEECHCDGQDTRRIKLRMQFMTTNPRLPFIRALGADLNGWGFFLCTQKDVRQGRTGDMFIALTLQDRT